MERFITSVRPVETPAHGAVRLLGGPLAPASNSDQGWSEALVNPLRAGHTCVDGASAPHSVLGRRRELQSPHDGDEVIAPSTPSSVLWCWRWGFKGKKESGPWTMDYSPRKVARVPATTSTIDNGEHELPREFCGWLGKTQSQGGPRISHDRK